MRRGKTSGTSRAGRRDRGPVPVTTLVLGASGFLGAHVVAALVARAARAGALAAPRPGTPRVLAAGRDVRLVPRFSDPRDAAQWLERDLAPEGSAAGWLEELAPGRVVLCAALARVAACEQDPALAERLNAGLPAEVARWCAARGARLVHVSTDLVFGAQPPPPEGFHEDSPPGPLSVYGRSKLAGEQAVLAACPAALVARLPLLYGNSGGRGLGASDSLLSAVDAGTVPPLFVDEHRTPLEVSNAAEALAELCEGSARGLLHVAGPERVSRLELGLAVLEGMGLDRASALAAVRPARRSEVPTPGARPADVSLDARRARELLSTRLLGVAQGVERAMR